MLHAGLEHAEQTQCSSPEWRTVINRWSGLWRKVLRERRDGCASSRRAGQAIRQTHDLHCRAIRNSMVFRLDRPSESREGRRKIAVR